MIYQDLLKAFQGRSDQPYFHQKRLELIKEIENLTGRPLIIYAAKLTAPKGNQIVLDDLIGFVDLVEKIKDDNLDVLIESPGGAIDAAERIVYFLRQKFRNVRFIVPGSAYSAATMICLSGNEILMDGKSSLGPIDPQINGIPARSIINGFDELCKKLQKEGPSALTAYLPLLQKYDLHILEICKDAEERGKQLVQKWLEEFMFANQADSEGKAKEIVAFFSDYNTHKSHARPIFISEALKVGVKVSNLQENPNIQSKIWDFYLCLRFLFDTTNYVKVFENSYGVNYGPLFQERDKTQINL